MSKIKEIVIIAIFSAILFVQEQALTFLPNIQLTVFLLVLYSKVFGFKKTSIMILIHVLLDSIIMGSLNFFYFPFMLVGWIIIPIIICTLFKKIDNNIILALMGIAFSFFYSWMFVIPEYLFKGINPIVYLSSDILWELVLALSSFLSILWLYKPCSKLLNKLLEKEV